LAVCAQHSLIGFLLDITAAHSFCGLTTPTPLATLTKHFNRFLTAFSGWVLIGTKGREWAGHTNLIFNPNEQIVTALLLKRFWRRGMRIEIFPDLRNSIWNARPPKLLAQRSFIPDVLPP
jgi:hypothetical protein